MLPQGTIREVEIYNYKLYNNTSPGSYTYCILLMFNVHTHGNWEGFDVLFTLDCTLCSRDHTPFPIRIVKRSVSVR